eukprot:671530-Prymnesium_polylepis.1
MNGDWKAVRRAAFWFGVPHLREPGCLAGRFVFLVPHHMMEQRVAEHGHEVATAASGTKL